MSVKFTQDAERERVANLAKIRASKSWELLRTVSLVEAVRFARDHGWAEKKVQVKAIPLNDSEVEYHVEPFEKDCRCPNLLRYADYF